MVKQMAVATEDILKCSQMSVDCVYQREGRRARGGGIVAVDSESLE